MKCIIFIVIFPNVTVVPLTENDDRVKTVLSELAIDKRLEASSKLTVRSKLRTRKEIEAMPLDREE